MAEVRAVSNNAGAKKKNLLVSANKGSKRASVGDFI